MTDECEMRRCLRQLVEEQSQLCRDASSSTLFAKRLQRRIILLKKLFEQSNKAKSQRAENEEKTTTKTEVKQQTVETRNQVRFIK